MNKQSHFSSQNYSQSRLKREKSMGGGTMHIDLPSIYLRPFSNTENQKTNNNLNLPVSSSSSYGASGVKPSCSASYCFCGGATCRKLEVVNRIEDKRAGGFFLSSVFGLVPSQFEVENAITALLNFVHGITSSQSELQWLQQILDCSVTRNLLSYGQRSVYDAVQLLQTDSSVKRLVVSLSSDQALWDAVTNNELVRKFREPQISGLPQNSNEEPEFATSIMRWILDITRAKVMELVQTFQSLVNEMFLPSETRREMPTADNKDHFENKVRSSLLLSIVILLIVVVTRLQRI